jgi:membrane protease YdiL (CAAX protease family)
MSWYKLFLYGFFAALLCWVLSIFIHPAFSCALLIVQLFWLSRKGRYSTVFLYGLALDSFVPLELLIGISSGIGPFILLVLLGHFYGKLEFTFDLLSPSLLVLIIFQALLEELLFRGLAFQVLATHFSTILICILQAMFFACMHWMNPNADIFSTLNTFLAGIWMNAAWFRTRALWIPITFHILWNIGQILLNIPLSGMHFSGGLIVLPLDKIPSFFINTAYGFESTPACTLILLILLLIVPFLVQSPYRTAAWFRQQYSKECTDHA